LKLIHHSKNKLKIKIK